jgi:hypothetical protein
MAEARLNGIRCILNYFKSFIGELANSLSCDCIDEECRSLELGNLIRWLAGKKLYPIPDAETVSESWDDFINTVSEGWQYASCTWYQTPKHEIGLKKLGVVLDEVKAEYPLMTLELSCFGKEGLDSIGKLLKTVYKLGEK